MNNKDFDLDTKAEENRLYVEYKKKSVELKKIRTENEAVGQVFTKGLLPIYIFYILSLGATNGNEIAHKIGIRTKGRWVPSTGGIYPILKKLEKEKMMIGKWDDSHSKIQKIYNLTDIGIKEFKNKKILLKSNIENALEVFNIIYGDLYK